MLLANLRFLAGYRRPGPLPEELLDEVLAAVRPGDTIGGVTGRMSGTRRPGDVKPAVLRLAWQQRLATDLLTHLDADSTLAAGLAETASEGKIKLLTKPQARASDENPGLAGLPADGSPATPGRAGSALTPVLDQHWPIPDGEVALTVTIARPLSATDFASIGSRAAAPTTGYSACSTATPKTSAAPRSSASTA